MMKAQNSTLNCLECCEYVAETSNTTLYERIAKLLNKLVIPGLDYISRIK